MALCRRAARNDDVGEDVGKIAEPVESKVTYPVPVAEAEREAPDERDDEHEAVQHYGGQQEASGRQPRPRRRRRLTGTPPRSGA